MSNKYIDRYSTKETQADIDNSGQADSKPSDNIEFEVNSTEDNNGLNDETTEDVVDNEISLYDNDEERQLRVDVLGEEFVDADDLRLKRLLTNSNKKKNVSSKDFLSEAGFELLEVANSSEFKEFANKKNIGDKHLFDITSEIIKNNDVSKIKFLSSAVDAFKSLKESRPVNIGIPTGFSQSSSSGYDKQKVVKLDRELKRTRVGSPEYKEAIKRLQDYLKEK
jgi:hypothetical protein